MSLFIGALVSILMIGEVVGTKGEEPSPTNEVVESEVEVVSEFRTPELDATLFDTPFSANLDTPLSYTETQQLLLDMREEQIEQVRAEQEATIQAHLEAMVLIEKEIEAAKIAEAQRLAEELAAQEEAEKEKARIEQEQAELAAIQAAEEEYEAKQQAQAEAEKAAQVEESSVEESEPETEVTVANTPTPAAVSAPQPANSQLLAQLVESEAKGEPYQGKVAVAEVVLNRVNSGEFPNSIEGVIYQPGQFQVVSNGSINNTPSEASIRASNEALAGSNYANGALFFYNPRIATDRWQDSLRTTAVIGNHTFKVR